MENPKMNLQIVSSELTMTSREIAELLECRHDSVKRTIERLVDAGLIQLPPMVDVKNGKNQTVSEYVIGKRDTYVIVAQLSPEFTARLVDRWQELEAAQKPALPATYKEALKALVAEVEAKEVLEQQLAIAAPKAQFVDKYVEASSGSMGFREVCKMLKAKESDFRNFLYSNKIMYKLNGTLTPFSKHLDAGRFEVKTGIADNEHTFKTAKFTAKGVEWVSKLWNKENAK